MENKNDQNDEKLSMCDRCIHSDICAIRCNFDVDDERALTYCREYTDSSTLVFLPCINGEKLYKYAPSIDEIIEYTVSGYSLGVIVEDPYNCFSFDEIGRRVFRTRKEAEEYAKKERSR
jgi:hypothetical protein